MVNKDVGAQRNFCKEGANSNPSRFSPSLPPFPSCIWLSFRRPSLFSSFLSPPFYFLLPFPCTFPFPLHCKLCPLYHVSGGAQMNLGVFWAGETCTVAKIFVVFVWTKTLQLKQIWPWHFPGREASAPLPMPVGVHEQRWIVRRLGLQHRTASAKRCCEGDKHVLVNTEFPTVVVVCAITQLCLSLMYQHCC